ncbi:peptide-methionine (S)-S-oxide reductase MsrA [Psychromonas sp.]|nr:peptide-methionine (S)-S-oxide reductase MsrA [Psychromonas sp.]
MIVGGGCFWCIEAAFNQVEGVMSAISGYCGGNKEEANYNDVCSGHTNHVEVVSITFNDEIVDFERLLILYFSLHDATQVNRQGNDIGTQYRSVIFYQNPEQEKIALALIEKMNQQQVFTEEIATKVEAADVFYKAEDYHQGYYLKNPNQGYCMAVVAPKFQKFKAQHQNLLKKEID